MTSKAKLALALLSALLPFGALQGAEDEALCREIASVVDLYLSGKTDIGELKAIDMSDSLSKGSLRPEDPARRIVSLLGGASDVDMRKVAVQTAARPDLWALASAALFVRTLSSDPSPDADLVANAVANYQDALSSGASLPCAVKWRDRIPAWQAWCAKSLAVSDGLEPLLRKRSRDPKTEVAASGFEDISLDEFKKSRQPFAKRPMPMGLSFRTTEIEKYLASIDNDRLRSLERARYDYIKGIKPYILRLFVRSPYNGKVKLAKNRVVSGTVALANEKFMLVRDPNTEKSVKCEWDEVMPEQFADFLSYFAKMRIKLTGPNLSDADKSRQTADDLAHAAALCDWYGRYQDAIDYAKLATRISPGIKPELVKVLLGR